MTNHAIARRGVRGLGSLPVLVLGAMGLDREDDVSFAATSRVLEAAFAAGIDVVDTAPLYGFGASERVLGRFLHESKLPIRVLTKVGLRWDAATPHGDVLFSAPGEGGVRTVRKDARPASIREEVQRSLERLRVSRLSLVQVHHHDRLVPLDETLSALVDLHREGLIEAVGVSNHPPDALEASARIVPRLSHGSLFLSTAQDAYSLLARAPERGLFAVAHARAIGVLAYSPLAQGLLSGTMGPARTFDRSDWRATQPIFSLANRRRIHAAVAEHLEPLARRTGTNVSAVALRWVLGRGEIAAAIVGARSLAQLEDALAASRFELTEHEHEALTHAFGALRLRTRTPLVEQLGARLRRRFGTTI
jgi:methylglyoxal reductase